MFAINNFCTLLFWFHPGAEAAFGDGDDNPVITIAFPVAAALVLFAVVAGVAYSCRRRRGDPEYYGPYSEQYSEQTSAPSGGRRETGASGRRETGSSPRRESGASVDQSEYYEYDE